jgi:hypothetical protein
MRRWAAALGISAPPEVIDGLGTSFGIFAGSTNSLGIAVGTAPKSKGLHLLAFATLMLRNLADTLK